MEIGIIMIVGCMGTAIAFSIESLKRTIQQESDDIQNLLNDIRDRLGKQGNQEK